MGNLLRIPQYPDYYYDPHSGMIYVRFWVNGARKTRSTGIRGSLPALVAEIKQAVSSGRKIISGYDSEKESMTKFGILVQDWQPKWIESLETSWKSKASRADAKSRWKVHLSKFFFVYKDRPLDVREINEGLWLEYAAWFQKKNPGRMLKHHRAYLRHFLYFMHEQRDRKTGERLLSIVPELKDYDPATESPGRSIELKEESNLLDSCNTPQQRLQILMGIYMGMRPGEVCTCQKKFINWDSKEIDLPSTFVKTGRVKKRGRSVPIHPKVEKELKAQFDSHTYEPLFPSPKDPTKAIGRDGNKKAWARIKRDAGIVGRLRRHDMRVTRATRFAEQGVSEQLSQDVLGMSKEVMDRHYTKFKAEGRKKVYQAERRGKK